MIFKEVKRGCSKLHRSGLVRIQEWERSRSFKGVASCSLYLLLMSGIPTHPIGAANAWGQPMLRNSRCYVMNKKRNTSEPGEGKVWEET